MAGISQKTLAERLGLSQATVSRALRNDHNIHEETRRKVWETAEALGYRPSVALASFASKAHWTAREMRDCPVAVIYQASLAPGKRLNSVATVAIESELQRRGFRPVRVNLHGEKEIGRVAERLYHQGVQGVVISAIREDPGWFHEFDFSRFAVVSAGMRYEDEPVASFFFQHRRQIEATYYRIWERGYRRIGAALWGPGSHPGHNSRVAGFLAAQAGKMGRASMRDFFILDAKIPGQKLGAKLADWAARRRLDAMIVPNANYMGLLEGHGYGTDRIGFARALGATSEAEVEQERLAGFVNNHQLLARLLVQWLEQLIRLRRYGLEESPMLVSIPGRWKDAASLPQRIVS